jgi:two-component system, OmpR family, response regulator
MAVTLRIFLVEDNAIIRENLTGTLAELADATICGYAVGEQEASAWLLAHPAQWDLAVVDVFLKEGNGIGVVAATRSRNERQKVVVLTNFASPQVRERCRALGADAVFDKSNDIDSLIEFCVEFDAAH